MANTSIYHNVSVIQQGKANSCWYTCMQMMTRYCRSTGRSSKLVDPADDPICQGYFLYDNGMPFNEAPRHAARLGYTSSFVSLNPDGLSDLLASAPVLFTGLWTALQGHWVLINGLSNDEVSFIDPLHGSYHFPFDRFFNGNLKASADTPVFYPQK